MESDGSVQIAYSNPKPGREDEFNEWYDSVHLPDVVKIPGYVSGQRYRLASYQRPHLPPPRHSYMAIYQLGANLEEIFAAREESLRAGVPDTRSDTVNPDYMGYTGYLWVPMGPRLLHEEVAGG